MLLFLYVTELPLIEFPKEGYEVLKKVADTETEGEEDEEEEEGLLLIRYASTPGTFSR